MVMEEEDERIQQKAMEVKLKREKIEGILRERENAIQKVYIILSHMYMYIHTRITYNTHSKCTHTTHSIQCMCTGPPPSIHVQFVHHTYTPILTPNAVAKISLFMQFDVFSPASLCWTQARMIAHESMKVRGQIKEHYMRK